MSEVTYLRNNFETKTWIEIAAILDRTPNAVAAYARDYLGLKRKVSIRKNSWKIDHDNYLINSYLVEDTWIIANKLNRTFDAVKARVSYLRSINRIN